MILCLRSLAVPLWTFWCGCEPFPLGPLPLVRCGEHSPLWGSRSCPESDLLPFHAAPCRELSCAPPSPPTHTSYQWEGEGRGQALVQSGPWMVSLPDEGTFAW